MTDTSDFWSRRRAAVQAEADAQAEVEDEARLVANLAEKDDETVLQEMGLPDPETLEPGDDFAAFMARDVPNHLRNRALRKLWRSNPVLACVDGLNEYDDDFRAAMLAGGPIQTAYQVGKGMMAHLEEMARQEQHAATEEEAEEEEDDAAEDPVAEGETDAPVVLAATEVAEPDNHAAPAPRRMRFHFEEAPA